VSVLEEGGEGRQGGGENRDMRWRLARSSAVSLAVEARAVDGRKGEIWRERLKEERNCRFTKAEGELCQWSV